MADDFELRLQRVLRTDAERAVRVIDPVQLALEAAATPVARRPLAWRPAGWPLIRIALIASALLLAALATLWLVAGGLPTRPSLVEVAPSPTTDPSTALSLQDLTGPWMADRPPTLSFGGPSASGRMSLFFDSGGAVAWIFDGGENSELMLARAVLDGDTLTLTARADTASVNNLGVLRGCATGEAGTYRLTESENGLLLDLESIDDPCPSRAFVYARTWTRSLGLPNTGGPGVVDAFDPLLTVTLPPGAFSIDRSADHLTIYQEVPEFQFLAWKNPQGWNDPCDLGKGRYPIEPGADAFVDYFRQLQGFTVDSTSELLVDGHRAVRLGLHANPDVACPQPFEFVTATEPGTRTWFLRPGDTDALVIVELTPDTTLMFEVLPAPNALEDQVISSIRFLDGLPASP